MSRSRYAGALVLALILAACTDETSPSTTPPESVDRLVVLDEGGNVVTIDPDGSNETVIASRDSLDTFYFQPIWSPGSDRIAWGQGGFDGFGVGFAAVDTDTSEVVEMPSNPFYLYWSPDGELIAALHNSSEGAIDLEMVDTSTLETSVVANGAPFYFSWDGTGSRVVAHVEEQRFEMIESDGNVGSLGVTSPGYQTPQWTEAGIIHLLDGELVLLQPGGDGESIATVSGPATFVATTNGERLAAQVLGSGGITASLTATPALPRGGVVVLDLVSGEVAEATSEPALAFFWSPDGQSLLILEPGDVPGMIEMIIWDGTGARSVVTYSPHESFVNELLPFFTQYAQSVRLWSPDSESFAFAGAVDGTAGIWVQPAGGGEPGFVTEGSWVSWSTG